LYRPPPPPPPATIITFAVKADAEAKVYVVFDVVEDTGVIVPISPVYAGVSA
jgi:hypothetical protein